jgi:hypothetical protein
MNIIMFLAKLGFVRSGAKSAPTSMRAPLLVTAAAVLAAELCPVSSSPHKEKTVASWGEMKILSSISVAVSRGILDRHVTSKLLQQTGFQPTLLLRKIEQTTEQANASKMQAMRSVVYTHIMERRKNWLAPPH